MLHIVSRLKLLWKIIVVCVGWTPDRKYLLAPEKDGAILL